MIEIFGYIAAIAVGIVLGMIGAGGAILTVPIMVYLMGVNPVLATVYSLFIVGFTTLTGSVNYIRNGLVNFKTSFAFAVASLISIFLTRKFILPSIPEVLFKGDTYTFTKGHAILFFFSIIMLLSSLSMIFANEKIREHHEKIELRDYIFLFLYGILVGLISGMVGAGGGFLIVPALVFLAKIPVKSAIGTSLLIISANSITGFIGDLLGDYQIDWKMLLLFLAFAISGIFAGTYIAKHISGKNLKKGFGWFVLVMGIYIIAKEFFSLKH